jgi:hypothetical protein
MSSKNCRIIMWDNEGGKCGVVLLNDIYKDEKLVIDKNYKLKYGLDNFDGVLKMIGVFCYYCSFILSRNN